MCKAMIHYREHKFLSGIDISEKARKVSKKTNGMDVFRKGRESVEEYKRSGRFQKRQGKCRRRQTLWTFSDYSSRTAENIESCQVIYSQLGLAIHQKDHQARRRFVEWAQNEIAVVPDFHKRILFSDEAHFWLNGYVNKQNCHIWSEANPQVYVETPLHPEKLTVWCALWAGGIIGPYFFKSDEGHNVTVNGDRYRAVITNFFIPELKSHDVQELWFQQDGTTCHTARAPIDLLKDTFGDRLISRFGPVNWPPRSCDLTPLDYFFTTSQRSHLTDSEAWRVVGRLEGGQTQAEVAQATGVSQSGISRNWNSFLETESAGRRPGQSRRRPTTPNEDCFLVLMARRHRNMNASLLQ
ncbi:putative transposable element [Trichonephila clavipes]|nr:putative transposable element [Trichonephila clavipes]